MLSIIFLICLTFTCLPAMEENPLFVEIESPNEVFTSPLGSSNDSPIMREDIEPPLPFCYLCDIGYIDPEEYNQHCSSKSHLIKVSLAERLTRQELDKQFQEYFSEPLLPDDELAQNADSLLVALENSLSSSNEEQISISAKKPKDIYCTPCKKLFPRKYIKTHFNTKIHKANKVASVDFFDESPFFQRPLKKFKNTVQVPGGLIRCTLCESNPILADSFHKHLKTKMHKNALKKASLTH